MAKQFDATLKHLVESRPLDWLDLIGLPHRSTATAVDADVSSVSAAADKVLLVESELPYLAHFEFQSGPDPDLDERMMLYNVLLRWRHRKPVRSVAILLSPKAAGPRILGRFEQSIDSTHRVAFAYRLLTAWTLPIESLLQGGLGTLPLAAVAASESDFPAVVAETHRRIASLPSDLVDELLTSMYLLGGLRHGDAFLTSLFAGVRNMEESATYQAIIRKGELEGRRDDLLVLGTKRFGEPSPQVLDIIKAIHDPQRLATLFRNAFDAASWTELLAS